MPRRPRFPRRLRRALALTALLLAAAPPAPVAAAADLVLILDASGSMWGQIGGEAKITIARRVLARLVEELPDGAPVGLVAYGHRRDGDCADVETLVPLAPLDRSALTARVEALNPKGKTPIAAAARHALDLLADRGGPATVILISDGLETCGGDPCATARRAREEGAEFVLHVVGFDLGDSDASQLECAAQAGGGLYFDARDAGELASALERAVEAPADPEGGRLRVGAVADGAPADAIVKIFDDAGEEVAAGRTYTGPETNPREIVLPDGTYRAEVSLVRTAGAALIFDGITLRGDEVVERTADFSSGELRVRVTRDGELSDASVRVVPAGGGATVASGRTYTSPSSNPKSLRLAAGTYDVEIASLEIAGQPRRVFSGVTVGGSEPAELTHDFASATLRVGAVLGGELVDARVAAVDAATGKPVAQGRTYTNSRSNPKSFVLPPGTYRVQVGAIKLDGRPERELEVTVAAGETVERTVDFGG